MRKRKPISDKDWLRRKVIPEFLETGIIPTQKHHTIPKHHGGKDSPLIEVTFKEHAEIHLEYGKKHNCKRCIDQYPKLMGLWNTFVDEVEKFTANEITKNYDDYLDLTNEKLSVSENDIMFKERVELDENINYEDNWKDRPDADIIKQSFNEEVRGALDTLSERESIIIKMFYGIDRELPMRTEYIAEEFDLSLWRVKEILWKGEQRLKHRSRSKALSTYLNYF